MKKLLIGLLVSGACGLAFADSPVTFPITCANNISISATATLAEVQKCQITKQETDDGMYKVKFTDANKHSYECYFANNKPLAKINHCES
jgi:predicted lactoylglutathione lyase